MVSAAPEKTGGDSAHHIVLVKGRATSWDRPFCRGNGATRGAELDVGPGLTVPDEQLSHGCHSSNMSGHAIPAMPHGNHCAALFDAEPTEDEIMHGGQTATMFDLLKLLGLLCSTDFHSDC